MFAAIDAQYLDGRACVACVTFEKWGAAVPERELTTTLSGIEDYRSGEFWRREVPCALAVLRLLEKVPDVILIDGYVWLDDSGRKGMGAYLFEALNGAAGIVGVAKRPFAGSAHAGLVRRGQSKKPLFVTARGVSDDVARQAVSTMHGGHRTPTLLKRVDQLCRQGLVI